MPSPPRTDPAARQVRFEAVYAANHMSILGYALRRTASPDDAADVLAETFLTAWRRLDELPSGDEARLWLYGVARRVLANFHRGERRRSALAERLRAELSYSYVPPELTGETARLAGALGKLPEQDRELLTLAAWEGLDYGQIAVVFACSRNAVRIRLHRARQKLAKELDSYPERLPASHLPPQLSSPGVAGHARPLTLQVFPASPSLVGSIMGGNYAPGVKDLTGQRRCYYPSAGGTASPCVIGFTVPTNLKDEGSVWIGGPAKPGQQYATTGSIFAPGEALAGLLKQVAGQPLSKVRPILASHHLKIVDCRDKNNHTVNPDSVPGDYYITNIMPLPPGQVIVWTSPKQSWGGSERVDLPSALPPGTGSQPVKATPSPSTSH